MNQESNWSKLLRYLFSEHTVLLVLLFIVSKISLQVFTTDFVLHLAKMWCICFSSACKMAAFCIVSFLSSSTSKRGNISKNCTAVHSIHFSSFSGVQRHIVLWSITERFGGGQAESVHVVQGWSLVLSNWRSSNYFSFKLLTEQKKPKWLDSLPFHWSLTSLQEEN